MRQLRIRSVGLLKEKKVPSVSEMFEEAERSATSDWWPAAPASNTWGWTREAVTKQVDASWDCRRFWH